MTPITEKISALKNGETLIIPKGTYFIDKTIELKNKKGIKIKAEDGVFFKGSVTINKKDIKDYDNKIKYIDLKKYNIELGEYGNRGFRRTYVNSPNELIINNKPYSVAKYPKNGVINYKKEDIIESGSKIYDEDYSQKNAILHLNCDRFSNWINEEDAYLGGYPSASWADDCIKIKSFNEQNHTVETTQPHLFGFEATGHSGWYIVNVFSELTEPGEYYTDTKKGIMYFIPAGEIDTIEVSVTKEVMMSIENCENITIDGITFENTRNSGIYIEGGESITVTNCVFRNLGMLAIQVGMGAEPQPHGLCTYHGERKEGVEMPKPISREPGSWHEYIYEFAAWDQNGGKNHRIENCKIYNTGEGGIILSGGDRKTLTPANNVIYNCEFYNLNRFDKTYRVAVHICGVGNKIQHCEMHDLTSIAINLHGNDHLIEYNNIYNVVTETSDSGAIYMGRDMSEVGNIFRANYIHDLKNPHETDLGVCAIYFDDWAIYNEVCDNFFYNICGGGFGVIHHTCGGFLSFHNNFVIDCVPGMQPDNKSNSYVKMHKDTLSMIRVHTKDENDIHGVDITSSVWKEHYPYLYETYKNDMRPEWMYYNNQITYHKYNNFKDGEHQDFTLVEEFGKLYRDEYDWMRRKDVVSGYEDELVPPHKVDFKKIGLIKK